ncbi:hypothetical protein A4X13_0g8732 [Tilletia indica]|uniref:Uncharacterized protein n=1 Tax=Tilletia indica TaxID=43049 RepID=A0A177T069_9BASI|nr:hypothetical protein A4X13_0g8732 [Tilletia indica]
MVSLTSAGIRFRTPHSAKLPMQRRGSSHASIASESGADAGADPRSAVRSRSGRSSTPFQSAIAGTSTHLPPSNQLPGTTMLSPSMISTSLPPLSLIAPDGPPLPAFNLYDHSWPIPALHDPFNASTTTTSDSAPSSSGTDWARLSQGVSALYAGKMPFVSRDLMQFPFFYPNDGTIDLALLLQSRSSSNPRVGSGSSVRSRRRRMGRWCMIGMWGMRKWRR